MYQLAIFDLDGTLIDSIADLAGAVNDSLRRMGYPTHPVASFLHFVGDGVVKLCERALPPGTPPEQVDRLLALFQTYYTAHCMDLTRPYDGIGETLDCLRNAGIRLAVASNKPQEFAEQIVTHFFGTDRFAMILGGNPTRPKKPSPEILLAILDTLDVSADDAVMIGDSDVDILTAKHAGMASVGCIWGFRGKEELEQAGADDLADSPKALLHILLES